MGRCPPTFTTGRAVVTVFFRPPSRSREPAFPPEGSRLPILGIATVASKPLRPTPTARQRQRITNRQVLGIRFTAPFQLSILWGTSRATLTNQRLLNPL